MILNGVTEIFVNFLNPKFLEVEENLIWDFRNRGNLFPRPQNCQNQRFWRHENFQFSQALFCGPQKWKFLEV